jgi:hypothetical protein
MGWRDGFVTLYPPYMQGPNLAVMYGAFGEMMDENAAQILWGRLQANPYAGGPTPDRSGAARLTTGQLIECEEFVLPIHAQQRGIELYPSEPVLSRRVRLSQWLYLKMLRATPWGTLLNVQPFWLPGALPWMRFYFQTNEPTPRSVCYTLGPNGERSIYAASPSVWNWDGQDAKRTRFWVVIHLPPGYANGFLWDNGTPWDSGALWDGIASSTLADLAAALDSWHSSGSWFAGLIVTALQPTDSIPGHSGVHPFDPASSVTTNADGSTNMPDGNWGSPVYTSGANIGLPTRPSWALFYSINNG